MEVKQNLLKLGFQGENEFPGICNVREKTPQRKPLPEVRPVHAPDNCGPEVWCVGQPPTLPSYSFPFSSTLEVAAGFSGHLFFPRNV